MLSTLFVFAHHSVWFFFYSYKELDRGDLNSRMLKNVPAMILAAAGNENLWYRFYFECYFLITPTFLICIGKRPELVRLQLGHQADAASRSVEPYQKTRDNVKRTLIFTNDDQINELNSNGESSVSSFRADDSSSNPTMGDYESLLTCLN